MLIRTGTGQVSRRRQQSRSSQMKRAVRIKRRCTFLLMVFKLLCGTRGRESAMHAQIAHRRLTRPKLLRCGISLQRTAAHNRVRSGSLRSFCQMAPMHLWQQRRRQQPRKDRQSDHLRRCRRAPRPLSSRRDLSTQRRGRQRHRLWRHRQSLPTCRALGPAAGRTSTGETAAHGCRVG